MAYARPKRPIPACPGSRDESYTLVVTPNGEDRDDPLRGVRFFLDMALAIVAIVIGAWLVLESFHK
jgi:hypothetical protein